MFGYHGQYLHVDLATATGKSIEIDEGILRKYLGGVGLGTYLLLKHGAAQNDPLGPDATIGFIFSPLVGSPLTTSAKFAVVCKSPLTNRLNDSLASSSFALAGKRTGYDAIVITGRAPQLSVLVVDESEVRLESADDLAGLSCSDADEQLGKRFETGFEFGVIGRGGENQVRYATISHDGRHAGRGGSGAVMGSKNLKAIAVRGDRRTGFADPDQLYRFAKQLSRDSFGEATAKYRELGTATNLLTFNRLNALPTRNFQQGSFAGADNLAPETLVKTRARTRASCAACTIGCEHIYGFTDKQSNSSSQVRLEYESLFALGPLCAIDDPDIVLAAAKKCDEFGLDTISAGATIAFAMECNEKEMIPRELDPPRDLQFGNGEALLDAIDSISTRRGFGDLLAEGSRRLSEVIGGESAAFAPHVKGMEIPGYEPRALQTMALGFAVGTRGADHNRSGAYQADFSEQFDRRNATIANVSAAIETENQAAIMDSLILCKFLRGVFEDLFDSARQMLQLVCGWEVARDEIETICVRIVNAKKQFNILAGWKPDEDTLPARFLQSSLDDDDRAKLDESRLNEMIAEYNRLRGWTHDGWIENETAGEIGG